MSVKLPEFSEFYRPIACDTPAILYTEDKGFILTERDEAQNLPIAWTKPPSEETLQLMKIHLEEDAASEVEDMASRGENHKIPTREHLEGEDALGFDDDDSDIHLKSDQNITNSGFEVLRVLDVVRYRKKYWIGVEWRHLTKVGEFPPTWVTLNLQDMINDYLETQPEITWRMDRNNYDKKANDNCKSLKAVPYFSDSKQVKNNETKIFFRLPFRVIDKSNWSEPVRKSRRIEEQSDRNNC